jgi:hypothetical protein
MRTPVIALIASALIGCSTAPQPESTSAEAEARLQQLLAGKVAGQPTDCLPHWRTDKMVIIDDDTIVFDDGSTVYRNEIQGECSRISSGFYTLVTTSSGGTGLCRGDIARVMDTRTGISVGSCVIGDFVPYRAP